MAAAQAGDRAAYDALLRECVPLVRRVLRRHGLACDLVDDVIGNVLLTLHRTRRAYEPARSFDGWLCAITRHCAAYALRHPGRRRGRNPHAPEALERHADAPEVLPGSARRV